MTLSEARADGCHLLVERFINSGEECASKGKNENVNENRFFHKDIQMDLRMLPVIVFVLCPGMSHEKQDEPRGGNGEEHHKPDKPMKRVQQMFPAVDPDIDQKGAYKERDSNGAFDEHAESQ